MRWPWQRTEARTADAAPAAAARSVAPAGWAFLPPLQRQLSDAAPAALRPAFVASLPTRMAPTSLGTMGHLLDDRAPAGTIAIDDGAPGAPVQRAVESDLALRPPDEVAGARAAQARHVQRVPDAAAHTEPEHAPDSVGPGPSGDLADESRLAPDESSSADEGPGADALADDPPQASRDVPEIESGSGSGTTGPSEPAVAGLIDRGLGMPVARLPEGLAVPTGGDRRTSARAAPTGDGAPLAAARDSESPVVAEDSSPTGLLSDGTTVQRIASSAWSGPVGPATGRHDESSPGAAPPRRIGLGAPLAPRSPERGSDDGAPVAERPADVVARLADGDDAGVGATVAPVAQRSTDAQSGLVSGDESAKHESAKRQPDDGQAPLQRETGADDQMPLITAAPLTPATMADAASEASSATTGERMGTAGLGATAQLAPSSSGMESSPSSVVQRELAPDRTESEGASSGGSASLADAVSDAGAAPSVAMTPVAADAVGRGPSLASGSSTVPLVAARRIVPAITHFGGGPGAAALGTGGRVVVARVVAPMPPSPPGGDDRPRAAAAIGRTTRESVTTESEGDAGGSNSRWPFDEPAVVASVSRLTAPPAPASASATGDAAWHPTQRMPVGATAQALGSAGHRSVGGSTAVQRLPGLPSLGQLPLDVPNVPDVPDVPDIPDVPDVGQLGSRAEEAARAAASDATSRATDAAGSRATDALRDTSELASSAAQARPPAASATPAAPAAGENVEQLVRKLYGPIVRRIKAELLLDRERRGIRIDGI